MTDDHAIDQGRQAILDALERHQVRYVVIGGAAAQARGWPEPTDDIDVTPERSEDNLTRLAAAVQELDAGFRVDPARYPEGYRPPDGIDARTFRNQVSIEGVPVGGPGFMRGLVGVGPLLLRIRRV
jgi:hypothetical protein